MECGEYFTLDQEMRIMNTYETTLRKLNYARVGTEEWRSIRHRFYRLLKEPLLRQVPLERVRVSVSLALE